MNLKKIMKFFDSGNVSVAGLRGRGKDMLMANVYCRNGKPYVSNIDYGGNFVKYFDINDFDLGGNTFKNFLSGDVKYYSFPFEDGTDVILSDSGVYLPAQYNAYLDNKFGFFSAYACLSRQCGLSNFHHNSQAPERTWVKIREQSDIYLRMNWCVVPFYRTGLPFFKDIVFQRVTIYSKYESFVDAVPPYRNPRVRLNADRRLNLQMEKQRYRISHGEIKSMLLIYRNISKYDTRFFRTLMLNGKRPEEENAAEVVQKIGSKLPLIEVPAIDKGPQDRDQPLLN